MINFPYVIGQYEEVTDHVFTIAAMRTGQVKKKQPPRHGQSTSQGN